MAAPLIVDHDYHLFSLAHYLVGEVERVYAWIDRSPIAPLMYLDAPATIMFQFKAPRRLGRPRPSRWKESSGTIASSPAPGT